MRSHKSIFDLLARLPLVRLLNLKGGAGYCLQLWKSGWRPLAAQTITSQLPWCIRTRRESWRPRPSNSKLQPQRSVPMKPPRGFGGEH